MSLATSAWGLEGRNPETTQQYIHLSGRDHVQRLAQGMEQIHAWRIRSLTDAFLHPEQ